ncbi:MAG: MMPL family transporter, partial [[Mycobacterium] stephanolepidis]
MWEAIARFCSRYAFLVIGIWVLAAAAGNLLVPQVESTAHNHARGFLPHSAPVNTAGAVMGRQFQDGDGGNLNYLVLESDHKLGPVEHQYHDRLLAKLRADTAHLDSAMDLWADPLT